MMKVIISTVKETRGCYPGFPVLLPDYSPYSRLFCGNLKKGTIFVVKDRPDKQWKRSDGIIISDKGGNIVPNRFDGDFRAFEHYETHRDDYPGLTQAQYVQKAADLASNEVKGTIIGFSSDDGCVIRYDKRTNDFAKAYPGTNGYVRTLYKPIRGIDYYHDEKKRSWKFRKGVKK